MKVKINGVVVGTAKKGSAPFKVLDLFDPERAQELIAVDVDAIKELTNVAEWLRSLSEARAHRLKVHALWVNARRQVYGADIAPISTRHMLCRFVDYHKIPKALSAELRNWAKSVRDMDLTYGLEFLPRHGGVVRVLADEQVCAQYNLRSFLV